MNAHQRRKQRRLNQRAMKLLASYLKGMSYQALALGAFGGLSYSKVWLDESATVRAEVWATVKPKEKP